jgi:hypothetical protein
LRSATEYVNLNEKSENLKNKEIESEELWKDDLSPIIYAGNSMTTIFFEIW